MGLRLPFERVAILSPTHCFTHPRSAFLDREMLGELRVWHARVQVLGADALYARVAGLPAAPELVQALVDMGMRVLAPMSLHSAVREPFAWHFSAADLEKHRGGAWPDNGLRGLSCHNIGDLELAEQQGFDYAFLSPIFATQSHPDAIPLGMDLLEEACERIQIPIIALGGMDFEKGGACLAAGAAGWAGIRCWL